MTISIDSKIRRLIEGVALAEHRSLSSVIEVLLMRHFAIPEKRPDNWTKKDQIAEEMEFSQEDRAAES